MFLLLSALLANAQAPGPPLSPSGKWTVDYGSDRCTLLRRFGSGLDERTVAIQPIAGLTTVKVTLVAPANLIVGNGESKASLVLAPANKAFPAIGAVAALPDGRSSYQMRTERAILDELPSATRLDVNAPAGAQVSVALDGGASAVAGLRGCERDLLVSWGVDPNRFRTLVRPGQPGYVDLLPYVGVDNYPPEAISAHAEGRVVGLVRVGSDGKATACRAIESSGSVPLDTQTCAISARIRYPVWPDATGQPAGYWTVISMKWVLPD